MRELVEADLPLVRRQLPLQEAIDYFSEKRQFDKVACCATGRRTTWCCML
jgi:hypothetical protein